MLKKKQSDFIHSTHIYLNFNPQTKSNMLCYSILTASFFKVCVCVKSGSNGICKEPMLELNHPKKYCRFLQGKMTNSEERKCFNWALFKKVQTDSINKTNILTNSIVTMVTRQH